LPRATRCGRGNKTEVSKNNQNDGPQNPTQAPEGGDPLGREILDPFTPRGININSTRSNIVRPTVFARIVWAARVRGLEEIFSDPVPLGLAPARPRLITDRPLRGLNTRNGV